MFLPLSTGILESAFILGKNQNIPTKLPNIYIYIIFFNQMKIKLRRKRTHECTVGNSLCTVTCVVLLGHSDEATLLYFSSRKIYKLCEGKY
jgi:hypothetical protein